MEYDIKEEKYKIEIRGSPVEIRKFIRALDQVVIGRSNERSSKLDGYLNCLDDALDRIRFELNKDELIYFDKNSITYILNNKSTDFYFPVMRNHFEKTIEFIDELKEQNLYDAL